MRAGRFLTFAACVLVVQALSLPGCGPPAPDARTKLKVLLAPFLSNATLFIAQEEGFFAEQSLDVEFVKMDRAARVIPALAAGQLDVLGGSASVSLFNALARGADIRIVATKDHVASGNVTFGLVARRDLVEGKKLEDVTQLRGRRIVAEAAELNEYFLEKLLESAGLSIDDVELMNVPDAVAPDALARGTVDLVSAGEPWITRMLDGGKAVMWKPAADVIPEFQVSFIMYGPTFLEENPDAGRRFMTAYLKAARQYNQGKTERNIEIIAKYTKLDPAFLKRAGWPTMRKGGAVNTDTLLDFQDWALKRKYLDEKIPADRFWDPRFVEYAASILGTSSP